MKAYFVDTSYWLALELNDDQNHKRALEHWQSLIKILLQ
jgi:predicted nucleic acid-binding protein